MALREILVAFGFDVDTKELEKGEHHADGLMHKLEEFGKAAAAAFAVHEVKEFFESTVDGARELARASVMLGMPAEELQALEHAANMADVSAETLRMGIMRLQRSLFSANEDGGKLASTFRDLGIATKEGEKARDTVDILSDFAEVIKNTEDSQKRTGLAMQVFGRQGAQLLPFLLKGKEGFADLYKEIERLGGGFTNEFLEQTEKYEDAQKRLAFQTRSLRVAIVTSLLPAAMGLLHGFSWLIQETTNLNKQVDLSKIALSGFLLFALGQLPTLIGLVKTFALESAVPIAGWILLAVAIEDIIGLMTGADSLTGTLLDRLFGEGAAEGFRKSVLDMITSWEGFTDTLSTALIEAGGVVYKFFEDLFYWLLQKLAAAGDAVGKLVGGKGGAEQHIIDKRGEADAQWYQDMKGIKDDYVARRTNRAEARAQSEAMIENAKPGHATRQGTTEVVSKHYTLNDKTVISVNTLPTTTANQAREVGAAVKKAKAQSGDARATLNALEPAVE